MADIQGDVDFRFVQVSAPVRTVALLGLAEIHSNSLQDENTSRRSSRTSRIKNEETTPDFAATMARGPDTLPPSKARYPAALSTSNCTCISRYISPWTSSQSATHQAVHHPLRPTGGLFTTQSDALPAVHHPSPLTGRLFPTQQSCSPPAANTTGENPVI